MLDKMFNIFITYESIFILIGFISIIFFIINLLLIPFFISLIPVNYFINSQKDKLKIKNLFNSILFIIKNIFGLILLLAGFIMLFTPGQGIFSMILGLFFVDFPNKHKLKKIVINHKPTFKALNYLRAKFNKPPFLKNT